MWAFSSLTPALPQVTHTTEKRITPSTSHPILRYSMFSSHLLIRTLSSISKRIKGIITMQEIWYVKNKAQTYAWILMTLPTASGIVTNLPHYPWLEVLTNCYQDQVQFFLWSMLCKNKYIVFGRVNAMWQIFLSCMNGNIQW